MSFIKKVVAKPNLQVVKDAPVQDDKGHSGHRAAAESFLKFMEHFLDHQPAPKEFASMLLRLFEEDNAHGDNHQTLNSYAKAEFDALAKFFQNVRKEAEVMYNKQKAARKKRK